MTRNLRNLASVLALTAATALTVFATVQYALAPAYSADQAVNVNAASVASTTTQTCPRTGCTASSCHATQGGGATAMRF